VSFGGLCVSRWSSSSGGHRPVQDPDGATRRDLSPCCARGCRSQHQRPTTAPSTGGIVPATASRKESRTSESKTGTSRPDPRFGTRWRTALWFDWSALSREVEDINAHRLSTHSPSLRPRETASAPVHVARGRRSARDLF
jgi:hypothetical protein